MIFSSIESASSYRKPKLGRLLTGVDDGLRQRRRAGAAALEASLISARERAAVEREPLDERELLVGVARAAVDRDDARQAELATIPR